MRLLVAVIALAHTACLAAPIEDAEESAGGVRTRSMLYELTITAKEPEDVILFGTSAPTSRARLTFEVSQADQEKLSTLCAVDRSLCKALPPEEGELLAGEVGFGGAHNWHASTLIQGVFRVDGAFSASSERAIGWLYRDGRPYRFLNTWSPPWEVEQGKAVLMNFSRAPVVAAAAFPDLNMTVQVDVEEYQGWNPCWGLPDDSRVCCTDNSKVCACVGGVQVELGRCPAGPRGNEERGLCAERMADPGVPWAECLF